MTCLTNSCGFCLRRHGLRNEPAAPSSRQPDMSTFTWKTLLNGDWDDCRQLETSRPSRMPPRRPQSCPAPLPPTPSTIAGGESEIVNTVTLGDSVVADVGPTLDVAGTLTFAGNFPSADFLSGTIRIEGGGVLAGQGALGSSHRARAPRLSITAP